MLCCADGLDSRCLITTPGFVTSARSPVQLIGAGCHGQYLLQRKEIVLMSKTEPANTPSVSILMCDLLAQMAYLGDLYKACRFDTLQGLLFMAYVMHLDYKVISAGSQRQ